MVSNGYLLKLWVEQIKGGDFNSHKIVKSSGHTGEYSEADPGEGLRGLQPPLLGAFVFYYLFLFFLNQL